MSQGIFEIDQEIIAAVKELRRRMELNQVEFSIRLGVSYGAVQKYEQRSPPQTKVLQKLKDLAESEGHYVLAETFEKGMIASSIYGVSSAKRAARLFLPDRQWVPMATWWVYMEKMPRADVEALHERMKADLEKVLSQNEKEDLKVFYKTGIVRHEPPKRKGSK